MVLVNCSAGEGAVGGESSAEEVDDPDPLLESVIVLEEFAKELAAIAFVKYHYAMD